MKMHPQEKIELYVIERVRKDCENHTIEALLDNGPYRHFKCSNGGSSVYRFDIHTWPGYLAFTGDMGDYVFSRTFDMIEFMRRNTERDIDYRYIAEKCIAKKDDLQEWSEELFNESLLDVQSDLVKELNEEDPQWRFKPADSESKKRRKVLHEKIQEIQDAYGIYGDPADAVRAMHESNIWDELPSMKVYTFHFLWCVHAIKWFCARVPAKAIEQMNGKELLA